MPQEVGLLGPVLLKQMDLVMTGVTVGTIPPQIADAFVVRILKAARIDLVYHHAAHPIRILAQHP